MARFYSEEEFDYIISVNRKSFKNNHEFEQYNDLINRIPTEFQLLDKNPLKNPLDLLEFLSGRHIMTTHLAFEQSWSPKRFQKEMKDMISQNFLSFCSESANFPGRVNFNVEQLTPFDEEAMIRHIQVKGPLLVLINGTHLRKHRRGEVLRGVPSSSKYA